jgi:hypothetical protein
VNPQKLELADAGRLFIRNLAMCFEHTLARRTSGGIPRRFDFFSVLIWAGVA